ncbi:transporter, small conductance mechanosensitive ion channel MscS family protein [Acetobacteraceae bacterium AT-5844]|nr:transporter, small conductance mechanosensitive ion channel MscS family protein [Acetobacteraceae bacterium AT-5844]
MRILFFLVFLLAGSAGAFAQAPAAQPAPAAVEAGEAQRLLGILRDDTRRAELMRTLEALSAAGSAVAPAPAAPAAGQGAAPASPGTPPATTPASPAPSEPLLAPNTLGSQLMVGISRRLEATSDQVIATVQAVTDLPGLIAWSSTLARDPVTQARVIDASWKLALLFGLGLLAEWLTRRALRGWRQRLDDAAPELAEGWARLRRVPLVLGRLLLDLLPVAAFAVLSYGLIGVVRPLPTTQLLMLIANNTYIFGRLVMAVSRMLLAPAAPSLRLVPLRNMTAAYVTLWLRRMTAVVLCGFALSEAGLLFGLPWGAYDAIQRVMLLIVSLFLGIIILQNRVAVSRLLRAPPLKDNERTDRARRALRSARDRLAEVWHILAILYLLALWAVWALQIEDGFSRLLGASAVTVVVLTLGKLLDMAVRGLIARGFRVSPDLASRYPGLEAQANRYVPLLKGIASGVLTVIVVMVLLEAWGLGSFNWFAPGELGARLLRSALSFGFLALVAVVLWEVVNMAMQRHLERLSRDADAARSARLRTLLPMLRTTLAGVIILFVALNLMTQIGVNVAPLLAGAGVIGLALGFGSQKLVQDVITGVFLLLEDAMAVGDVVTLGTKSGVVEQLSIRSIKLRDLDGSLHIIPFSAVNGVTNMTRDFSFALFDIQVTYKENTDRVVEVLSALCTEMRAEPKWSSAIRDEMEVMGVERLSPDGPVVRVRIKTEPIQRWNVRREMHRRIKQRFEELGIEIPAPRQRLTFEPGQAAPEPFGPARPEA